MASSTQKPSSSTSTHKHKFEVFLSFRGEDTRNNFTDHLFVNLNRNGIHTFRDDQLERGEEIKSELLRTIEESKSSIVVFSENYAHSKWCLDELAQIMECKKEMKQIVLPVFYHVDPADVRKQTGSFGNAFSIHETNVDKEKVQRWRAAMTEASNLSGCHVHDGYESKYIKEIIDAILKRLDRKLLHVDDDIVGVDFRLKELKSLINSHLHDERVVGIYGIGGIGKTTIAKTVYNEIQCEFNGASFLENVKESFNKGCQLQLQQELLRGILRQNIELSNINEGSNIIKDRLCTKKVLIVIDDVDHLNQLKSLVGSREWFGEGSRIVVTTRDQHLLHNYGVDISYEVKELQDKEAIQLFNMHAFKQNVPKGNYVNLSQEMVDYAKGLPLALKVLGASLHGMTEDQWKSASDKLKRNLKKEINDVLRISFDGLDYYEKKVFLDLACFFKWEDKDFVSMILDSCNLYATCNIRVLCDKCLITILDNKIQMHDLIQQMGWTIIREDFPEDPNKWSRLWDLDDIDKAFSRKEGMENIETISLDLSRSKEIHLSSKALINMKKVSPTMKKLRLLKVYYSDHHGPMRKEYKVFLPKDFEFPPNLIYLHWEGYTAKSLPSNFHGENLVALNLKFSNIKELWKSDKHLAKLKFIDLSHSQQLIKIPEFSRMPKLERLHLHGCTSFRNLDSSIGVFHDMKLSCKLYFTNFFRRLNFSESRIKELPRSIGLLTSLEILDLSSCSKFEKLPDIFVNMGHLRCLYLSKSGIKELPSSIGSLTSLEILDLNWCSKFEKFPEFHSNMRSLRSLYAVGTPIKELPRSVGLLPQLKHLRLQFCKNLTSIPSNIFELKALYIFRLDGNSNLEVFPEITEDMEHLKRLYLLRLDMTKLPSSIEHLKGLRVLQFSNCKNLKTIPNNIGNLKCLDSLFIQCCPKLHKLPDSLRSLQLVTLAIVGCNMMEGAIPSDLWRMSSLISLDVSESNIRCIPVSIIQLSKLRFIRMNHCPLIEEIPELPSSLRSIEAHGCPCLETLSSDPTHLLWSYLLNCFKSQIQDFAMRTSVNPWKHWDGWRYVTNVVAPGRSGIPKWISHKSMGSEITIKLPKNWNEDNNLLGFALFFHHVPFVIDDDDDDDDIYKTSDASIKLRLWISNGDQFEDVDTMLLDHSILEISDDTPDPALRVIYFPQIAISSEYRSSGWNKFKARFQGNFFCAFNVAFKVKSCGIHLIYDDAQDHHQRSLQLFNVKRSHDDTEDHPHHKKSRHV